MTLTDFLLARIAEDETDAKGHATGWWPNMWRAEAEIEAKRGRIRLLIEMERDADNRLSSYAYDLLCREALPYADHADYDEEWNP